ncbi:MAG TPA: tyrosine-type recombinase/integrase [Candidatus Obscuribacterales bacterium]
MSTIVPVDNTDLLMLATSNDLLRDFVADKRSPKTKHEYTKDLHDFFKTITGAEPTPQRVTEFLQLDRFGAIALVLKYKQALIERGLKEATVNRRLSAIKSLVNYAAKIGRCNYSLVDIKSEKVKPYRDTSGITPDLFKKMLAVPDRQTLGGKRDYAILRLLWDNALRRGEVSTLNIADLDLDGRRLWILGKGRGTNKEAVALSVSTCNALQDWLLARRETNINKPLFVSLDQVTPGHRLTTTSIYRIVGAIAQSAGINKKLSPHRIRHSSVTAALVATNGDVRRVQKLSRHANLNTLMIYDDNRLSHQGEITDLLADLV